MIKEIYLEEGDVKMKIVHKLNGGLDIDIQAPHFTSVGTSIDASLPELEHEAAQTLACMGSVFLGAANHIARQLPTLKSTGDDPQADAAMGSAKTDEEILDDIS